MTEPHYKILEMILMAKHYKNRDDVIAVGNFIVKFVCSSGHVSPELMKEYEIALEKLKSLNFDEMNEIIGILSFYEQEEGEKVCKYGNDEVSFEEDVEDYGEDDYNRGMEFCGKNEYYNAVSCFRSAAHKGYGKAAYNLGMLLYTGKAGRIDRVEAIKRFVAASKDGVQEADKMLRYIAYGQE